MEIVKKKASMNTQTSLNLNVMFWSSDLSAWIPPKQNVTNKYSELNISDYYRWKLFVVSFIFKIAPKKTR